MKLLIGFITILFTAFAFAGFQAYQSGTSLGTFDSIKCSTGMTCSKVGSKLNVTSVQTGVLQQQAVKSLSGSVTVAECGKTLYSSGAIRLDLPTVSGSLGCRYTFVTGTASNLDINPQTNDRIQVLTDASGDMIRNAVIGSSITLEAVPVLNASSQYIWSDVSHTGTWTDAN